MLKAFIVAGAIYCIYNFLKDVIIYLIWKRKIKTFALVKELVDRKIAYKNRKETKIQYIKNFFDFEIVHESRKYNIEFCETLADDRESDFKINTMVPVYFDEAKQEIKSVDELEYFIKKSCKKLVYFVVAIIIILFCVFFFLHKHSI